MHTNPNTKLILNTKHIKRHNLANTIQLIMATGKISLLDLSKKLSLSTISIQQNVKTLMNAGDRPGFFCPFFDPMSDIQTGFLYLSQCFSNSIKPFFKVQLSSRSYFIN